MFKNSMEMMMERGMNNMKMSRMLYAFNVIGNDETEIQIYDEIAAEKSYDWWTGKEGNEVTAKDFKAQLDAVNTPNILISMNSGGGDVFTANAIIAAINDVIDKGKKVRCVINGVCASAAVGIARTCPNVQIENGAYMMIHNPMAVMWGYYDATQLESTKGFLETIKEGIVDIYESKTNLKRTKIKNLMDAETWMTAKQAVEYGFADEVLHDKQDSEVVNCMKVAVINSIKEIPETIKLVLNKEEMKGAGEEMEIKTLDDLKKAYPEIVNQIEESAKASINVEEALKKERERLQAIDKLAGKVDPEVLNKAKYETFESAEKVALDALTNGHMINQSVLNAMKDESPNVPSASNEGVHGGQPDTKAQDMKTIEDVANKVLQRMGRKEK